MAWRDAAYGVKAADAGLDVIMSPASHTYFDYYPSDDPTEAYAIGGLVTLEKAYAFEPLANIPEAVHDKVLGTQCQVWREYMPDTRRVDYMLFPRACAHAEVAWSSPDGRQLPRVPRPAAHPPGSADRARRRVPPAGGTASLAAGRNRERCVDRQNTAVQAPETKSPVGALLRKFHNRLVSIRVRGFAVCLLMSKVSTRSGTELTRSNGCVRDLQLLLQTRCDSFHRGCPD